MNDAVEPCEGELHARFFGGGRRPAPVGRAARRQAPPAYPPGARRADLPERDRPALKRRLRRAWAETEHARALDQLRVLAGELERSHPGAAGSLREGLEETLTLTRLGIRGGLKRWQSGDMALRWTAAGMLEAERQFRRIIGYRDLAKLALAIERERAGHRPPASTPAEEAATLATA